MGQNGLDEIWADDLLDRKDDALFLYRFLSGQHQKKKAAGMRASFVLNIDADWGAGKSFFVERFAKTLELEGHIVARINAWRDDHVEDPYVAIMAAIDSSFAPYAKSETKLEKAWNIAKSQGGPLALRVLGGVGKAIVKRYVDLAPGELLDSFDTSGSLESVMVEVATETSSTEIEKLVDASLEKMIGEFQKADAAITNFRTKLEVAIATIAAASKSAPLFIVVDELDRCRPTYAIQLLERVKHLFDVDGVVFVFATNSEQLQHSITGAYGANFDGFRYLKRFFDRTYIFKTPTIDKLVSALVSKIPINKIRVPGGDLVTFLTGGAALYNLDLRAVGHVVEMIDATISSWPHRIPADMALLFPLCATMYTCNKAGWDEVDKTKLGRWNIGHPQRDRYRNSVDNRINVGQVFGLSIGRFSTMEGIINANNGASDPTQDYVRTTFQPEWNGLNVARDKPSIQTELADLVANAGRLTTLGES
jgi:hypothetical protein